MATLVVGMAVVMTAVLIAALVQVVVVVLSSSSNGDCSGASKTLLLASLFCFSRPLLSELFSFTFSYPIYSGKSYDCEPQEG